MFLVSGGFVGRTLKIGAFREKRLNDSPALAHNFFLAIGSKMYEIASYSRCSEPGANVIIQLAS